MNKKATRMPTLGEEIANSITHGLGAVAAIVGLVLLVAFAVLRGDTWHVVSVSVFGATLVLLYLASTLYHAVTHEKAKHVFKILDHAAIYLLIAGTYTPFMLVSLRGRLGWTLFGVVWGLAAIGVVTRIALRGRIRWLSLAAYLGMGWLVLLAFGPLVEAVAPGGIRLLIAGGLAYTLGVVFYVWRQLPYHHAIWHLFVLAGSVLHFLAVLFFVIPGREAI